MLKNLDKSKIEKFLQQVSSTTNHLNVGFTNALNSRAVNFIGEALVVRQEFTPGSGVLDILKEKTQRIVGLNSFDGNKLNANRIFIGSHIMVKYGTAPTGTSAAAVDYSTSLPAGLKCTNISAKQGKRILTNLPISVINDAAFTEDYYFNLGDLVFFKDQTDTSIELDFPTGINLAPGTDNSSYIEVTILGAVAVI